MQTLKVAAYAGLLLSLPLILFQVYAFVLPAFSPREKQIALPAMLGIPFLFIAGVVFGYFTVVPRAIEFLQNFNTDAFDVLIQAQPYYKFVIMLLSAMGLLFQIPIGIVAVTRVGIVTTSQLAHNRRYAILVIAVLAMLLPGQDPVTMSMMMAPMYVLFEGSILLSWLLDRRAAHAPTTRTTRDRLRRARARHPRSGLVRNSHAVRSEKRRSPPHRQGRLPRPRPADVRRLRRVQHRLQRPVRRHRRRDHRQRQHRRRRHRRGRAPDHPGPDRRRQDQGRTRSDAAAWAALAQARLRLANVGDNFDTDHRHLHRRGPAPAHRRRHRVGQVPRAQARPSPTSASPARWPRPTSRSATPTRPSPPKRS